MGVTTANTLGVRIATSAQISSHRITAKTKMASIFAQHADAHRATRARARKDHPMRSITWKESRSASVQLVLQR